jgi:hypothetical protein
LRQLAGKEAKKAEEITRKRALSFMKAEHLRTSDKNYQMHADLSGDRATGCIDRRVYKVLTAPMMRCLYSG